MDRIDRLGMGGVESASGISGRRPAYSQIRAENRAKKRVREQIEAARRQAAFNFMVHRFGSVALDAPETERDAVLGLLSGFANFEKLNPPEGTSEAASSVFNELEAFLTNDYPRL